MRDPRVKQTGQLGHISIWEAVTQLTDLPAEASWPLPVAGWEGEAAQPHR